MGKMTGNNGMLRTAVLVAVSSVIIVVLQNIRKKGKKFSPLRLPDDFAPEP